MHFEIKLHIYPTPIVVSIAESDAELSRALTPSLRKEKGVWAYTKGSDGHCSQFSPGQILIRLKKRPIDAHSRGILVHEVHHACEKVFDWIGAEYEGECWAYLQQYIFTQIDERISAKRG